jgi:hypothetical protein
MTSRLPAAIVTACLYGAVSGGAASAQSPSPHLNRQERDALKAIMAAVDAAGADRETDAATLRTHVLRASDGSHYVAYTIGRTDGLAVPGRAVLYVRLATTQGPPERSLVRDWLTGNQIVAPPIAASRGLAFGEMPIMGATGSLEKRPPQTPEMASLTLMELERRRTRERNEERERQRLSGLEGKAVTRSETLPFEDFDLNVNPATVIQRALTAGPGDYFLYVATADPSAGNPASTIRIVKKRITLPPATTTELAIGSVILADGIRVRASAYPATEQASHPYAIGLTEIVPSADAMFADDEHLSLVFQVINAKPGGDGKPNVDIAFQIVRVTNGSEQAMAALTPQNYSAANLPPEFDLRVGHPLFATVTAPLSTLQRGSYRLKILVSDKIAGHTATTDAAFTVTATASSLLREAPAMAVPFRPESVLAADVLTMILATLRPAASSPALQRAFDLAAAGRFVDLLVEDPVPASEDGIRAALRGLAQLGVGDASAAVQFQRAQLLGAPIAPTRFLSGAARAAQARDADAIAAWQEALAAGAPRSLVVPQLLDAYVRRNDYPRAAALMAETKTAPAGWSRSAVATLIATQKERDAIAAIDARLAASPDDRDAQWLLLHALFAQLVRDPNAPAAVHQRFATQARAYIATNGAHAAVAEEWLSQIK